MTKILVILTDGERMTPLPKACKLDNTGCQGNEEQHQPIENQTYKYIGGGVTVRFIRVLL